jgi:hypothetical protein
MAMDLSKRTLPLIDKPFSLRMSLQRLENTSMDVIHIRFPVLAKEILL